MSLKLVTQLKKFPDIPVCTREEHRGSRHNSKGVPVLPPHPERRVNFPAMFGSQSRRPRRTSGGGGVHLTLERNSRVSPTISKDPRCPSALQTHLTPLHCLDGHAEDQLKTRWQL